MLSGSSQCVELLLRAGARVETAESWGLCALHHAASANDGNAILGDLLEAGASVDAQDDQGRTAFLMATQNGMLSNATVLLEHGARINVPEAEGWTPLLSCVFWNMHDSICYLLQNGTSLAVTTIAGDTLLRVVAQYGDVETINILVEKKAKDFHGTGGLTTTGTQQVTNAAGQTPPQVTTASQAHRATHTGSSFSSN